MKVWRSPSALMACTAMAMLYAAAPATAQESSAQEPTVLQTITVKGKKQKAASVASDTPLATQTTGEDIAKKEIGSIADLGNTTEPGLDYSKRTDGVVIRGLSGPRVVTAIDGIPIPYLENFARSGGPSGSTTNSDGGGSSFDFSSLSALDVLRGADSSRLGSGALGGALLLRTLEPEDLIEEGRTWGALTKLTYDSEDSSIAGSVAAAGRVGATSALFQGSYKRGHETDNQGTDSSYGPNRTKPNPLDFDQNNLLFKLRHDIEGGHKIGFTAERFDRDADIDMATAWDVISGRPPNFTTFPAHLYFGDDRTRRERVSAEYSYVGPDVGGFVESANVVAYWQRLTKNSGTEGQQEAAPGGTPNGMRQYYLRDNEISESAFGLTGNLTGGFTAGTYDHNILMGFDVSALEATQFTQSIPPTSLTSQADLPEVDGTRLGFFIEDRVAFGNTGFALTPGIRFDWHSYRPKPTDTYAENTGPTAFPFPGKNSGSRISPKLLATYQATPSIELFAQWSAAYRAPTVSELYLNFTNAAGGYAQIGNPDLEPETGHGFEVGANVGTEDFGGRVAVFHNRYRNYIQETPITFDPAYPALFTGVGSFENLAKVHISGIEIKAHKRFDNGFSVHGGLAYAYGKDVEADEVLRTMSPFKAVAGIGYERENWGVDLTAIFAGKVREDGPQSDSRGGFYETFDAPGYGIANLTGWWEPEQVKGMRIQAGVYNLFDKTYYSAASTRDINENSPPQPIPFYSEPGRSFKISLTQRF